MPDFIPTYYRVSIASMTDTAPKNGFIDNTTVEKYRASAEPSSLTTSLAKERGNMRYLKMLENISENATPVEVFNIVATGADVDTEATTFAFTVVFDRVNAVYTRNESSNNAIITGIPALKRQIARTFAQNITKNTIVYDPTLVFPPDTGVAFGQSVRTVIADAVLSDLAAIEANITISQITNT